MNSTTKNTIEMAGALGARGFTIASIEVHTPDGRTWNIAAVPASGGFRLFEIDRDQGTSEEHDAIEGNNWTEGELIDYLRAVGAARNSNS